MQRSLIRSRLAAETVGPLQVGGSGVFLTGGTGMLGANVLSLAPRNQPIYCLVRAATHADAMHRLEMAAFANQVKWSPLGILPILEEEDVPAVAEIWHIAARVDAFASINRMWPFTAKYTKFLGQHPKCTAASSLSVFTDTNLKPGLCSEHDRLEVDCDVYGGYAQVKTAAEYAIPNGTLVRFSLLTGRSLPKNHVLTLFEAALSEVGGVTAPARPKLEVDFLDVGAAAEFFLSRTGQGGAHHCSACSGIAVGDFIARFKLPMITRKEFALRVARLSPVKRGLLSHSFLGTAFPLVLFEAGEGWKFRN